MERKAALFMEGLGGWDCRSCLCPGRQGTSYLCPMWVLYLLMEDQQEERLAPTEGLFCLSWVVWVSSWQHHFVF